MKLFISHFRNYAFVSSTFIFIICSLNVKAQSQGKEELDALAMAKQSEKLRKEGKVLEADKKLFAGNDLFPIPFYLDEAAKNKMKIGDIKGANLLWNAIILKLKDYSLKNKTLGNAKVQDLLGVYYYYQINENFSSGNATIGVDITVDFINDNIRIRKKTLLQYRQNAQGAPVPN